MVIVQGSGLETLGSQLVQEDRWIVATMDKQGRKLQGRKTSPFQHMEWRGSGGYFTNPVKDLISSWARSQRDKTVCDCMQVGMVG